MVVGTLIVNVYIGRENRGLWWCVLYGVFFNSECVYFWGVGGMDVFFYFGVKIQKLSRSFCEGKWSPRFVEDVSLPSSSFSYCISSVKCQEVLSFVNDFARELTGQTKNSNTEFSKGNSPPSARGKYLLFHHLHCLSIFLCLLC